MPKCSPKTREVLPLRRRSGNRHSDSPWTLSKTSHTTFYGNRFVSLGIRYSSCLSWRSHSLFGGVIKHTLEHIALLSISAWARSETRATRATRAKIFIAKTMSDSIISTFLGHRRHKNPLLFKTGHFFKFTRVARVFVLDL